MDEVVYFCSHLKVSLRGPLVFTAAFTDSPLWAQSICVVIKQQGD